MRRESLCPFPTEGPCPHTGVKRQSPRSTQMACPRVCNDDAPETPKENMKVRLFPKKEKKNCKLDLASYLEISDTAKCLDLIPVSILN